MNLNIFRLNWILIDTIIIILLLLALVLVKIFKETFRYRSSFSNEALECIKSEKSGINFSKYCFIDNNWSLIINKAKNNRIRKKPLIVLIRTNKRKKLIHVLSEGLGSCGFNVLNLKIQSKFFSHSFTLNKSIIEEISDFLTQLIKFYKHEEFTLNPNYFLINYHKANLNDISAISDINNQGIILINPKLTMARNGNLHKIHNNINVNSSLYVIFNKKSIFSLGNTNYKKFLREFNESENNFLKIITLEKARRSFKYYETILLGILVNIIENNLLKS